MNKFAETVTVNVDKVLEKVPDEIMENSLKNESSDGDITLYKLPGGNLAVPILDILSSRTSGDYVHVRDSKCQFDICSKNIKSKKHTLVVKGVPMCPHSMLSM